MTTDDQPLSGTLTDAQRVRRIAELLCKAIVTSEAAAVLIETNAREDAPVVEGATTGQPDENRVLGYLGLAGEASPLSIRLALGLSRSKVYRILQRLNGDGQIVASGQTRSISYRLSRAEPPLDKIALN